MHPDLQTVQIQDVSAANDMLYLQDNVFSRDDILFKLVFFSIYVVLSHQLTQWRFCQASVWSTCPARFCLVSLFCSITSFFLFWFSRVLNLRTFPARSQASLDTPLTFLSFLQTFQEWTISASGHLPKSENIGAKCFVQRQAVFFIHGQKGSRDISLHAAELHFGWSYLSRTLTTIYHGTET